MKYPRIVGLLLVAIAVCSFWGWQSLRAAMLPSLDETALGGRSVEEQRGIWLAFDEALQCEVLDPCLSSVSHDGWSNPQAIARACGQAEERLGSLQTPAGLAPKLHTNVEFLRDYWLGDIHEFAKAAADTVATGKGGMSLLRRDLDTCTPKSLPARIDQLLEVVPTGAIPAHCSEIRRLRARASQPE